MKKIFGSKADNLEQLSLSGFNVPKFYMVASQAKEQLDKREVRNQLIQDFEKWISENTISAVAVRSSSVHEDSKDSSFAGQFKTVLDIKNGDDFIHALKTVLFSKQSEAYSKKTGAVHAIVQTFIEPDISGVIFSVNPANGNNEIVINAAQGRGTNVVDGRQAEQYIVNRLNPTDFTRVRDETKNVDSLSHDQIQELATVTFKIESLFGTPQDIEWAIKDKALYILQSRPITRINHLRLWDSSNIAESYPGIVAPLTFSIAKRIYMLGYKAQAHSAGLSWYEVEAQHRTFDSMIGIFNGKMYYNLLNWYKFISLFPGSVRNQKFLDDQIATQGEAVYQAPQQHALTFRMRFYARVLVRTIFFGRELRSFYMRFSEFEKQMASMPTGSDLQLLMLQYDHIEKIIPHFARTLDNDFFVMTYHGWLKKLLTRWLPNHPFERNSIIGSISGVLSTEQALLLYTIAEKFRADQTALVLLQKADFEALDTHLKNNALQKMIAEYIERFGHRFAEDQKIEVPNPTLESYGIYRLLAAYVQLDGLAIKERLAGSAATSKTIESNIQKQLRIDQRILYKFLLSRLKHHLRLREKNRLLRGKVFGYMRQLFPRVGQSLVESDLINNKSDVFYLQIEEIYQLVQGSLIANDLPERIARRRHVYEEFKNINMPERFITKGIPSLEKVEVIDTTSFLSTKQSLTGLISSPGTIEGRAVVLSEPKIPNEPYDILIAKHTDPGWTPLIALAKGVIVEHGGMLSHAAIVTRELGIPSIIGVKNVTSIIKTGMRVRINSQLSRVEILDVD